MVKNFSFCNNIRFLLKFFFLKTKGFLGLFLISLVTGDDLSWRISERPVNIREMGGGGRIGQFLTLA